MNYVAKTNNIETSELSAGVVDTSDYRDNDGFFFKAGTILPAWNEKSFYVLLPNVFGGKSRISVEKSTDDGLTMRPYIQGNMLEVDTLDQASIIAAAIDAAK